MKCHLPQSHDLEMFLMVTKTECLIGKVRAEAGCGRQASGEIANACRGTRRALYGSSPCPPNRPRRNQPPGLPAEKGTCERPEPARTPARHRRATTGVDGRGRHYRA